VAETHEPPAHGSEATPADEKPEEPDVKTHTPIQAWQMARTTTEAIEVHRQGVLRGQLDQRVMPTSPLRLTVEK
jgi:hypothetical protein